VPQDGWINKPPYNFTGKILEYVILPETYEEEYFRLLSDKQFVIFPNEKYEEIKGCPSEKEYVIAARSVYTNKGGIYRILENDTQEILIKYYTLGRTIKKINKNILLLEVNELPRIIYVSETGAI
jgi:tRNA A22 N-methylase